MLNGLKNVAGAHRALTTKRNSKRAIGLIALAVAGQAGLLVAPSQVEAASGTWTNNGNGNWSTSTNWASGIIADGVDSFASFTNDISATRTVTNDTPGRIIGNLSFTDTSNDWILTGTAANALTLNSSIGLSTVAHNSSGRTATISLILAGDEEVRKSGAGNIILSGANTYTGATSVYNGILFVGAAAPSGAAGALGNSTTAVLLGDPISSNSAQLLTSGGFTVGRDINVQAGNAGTITIGGNTANASIFSGAITLNKSANLTAASGGTVSVTGAISSGGAFGITKVGAGIANLSANNGYTGATSVTNGTLTVSGAAGAISGTSVISIGGTTTAGTLLIDNAGANNAARFSDSLGVTFTGVGGTLQFSGNATAASTETLGALTVVSGTSDVQVDSAAAGSTLTFATLNRTGGSINFIGTGGTLGGAGANDPRILFTAQAAGLLPRWATVGTNFATYNATNGVAAFTGYTELPASGFDSATVYQSTVNRTLTESGTIDSLKLNPTAVHTIDLGANSLTLAAGGLISTGAFDTTINGTGTLNATGALDVNVPAGRVVINTPLVITGGAPKLAKFGAGALEINNIVTAPSWFAQPVSIEGTLQFGVTGGTGAAPLALTGAVTGPGGLVITGPGVMSLANASGGNTFTGNILVDGGGLAFVGDGGTANDPARLGLGAKTVTLQNAGRLFVSGTSANFTSGGKSLVIGAGGGTVDVAGTGVSLQFDDAGQFSGSGVLTKTGTGTLHLGNQDFSGFTGGSILLNGGTLLLDRNPLVTGSVANRAVITMAASTTLALRANNTTGIAFNNNLITAGSVSITSGSSGASQAGSAQTVGTLDIGGASPTITIQNGSGIATNSAGSIRIGATTVTGTGSPTFNVLTNGTGTNILFLASLDEGASTRAFVKSGGGILRIDGAGASPLSSGSSFAVNAGKLEFVPGALGAASVTLNGGSLDLRNNSNGTFNNPLTLSASATVSAGLNTGGTTSVTHQASTLSLGSVTYALRPSNFTTSTNVIYGFTHTTTTLSGNPTFDIGNQGTGVGTLSLGAVSDAGVARTITKIGVGNLTFGASPTLANTTFNINVGGLVVGATGATGTTPIYNFGDTAANANSASILAGAGGVTIPEAITVRAGSSGVLSLGGINTSGTATFSGQITLNNNLALTAAGGGIVDFTNTLLVNSGTPTVTKTGGGTVILSGTSANSATGGTTVAAGTLQLNKTPGLGNGGGAIFGPVSVTGTLMNLGNEQVDDAAAVTLNTGGIWNLNGFTETIASLTYNGGAIVNGNGLVISGGAGTDLFLFDGTDISAANTTLGATARLIYAGSTTLGKVSGGLTLAATQQQFLINDGTAELDAEVSGVISGAGFSINKTDAGTILLSNTANTFGGGSTVTVSSGVLRIAGDGSLGDATNTVSLNGGAIGLVNGLNYSARTTSLGASGGGFDVATGAAATVSGAGVPTGTSTLFKSGGGTLTLGSPMANTGALDLRGGFISFDDPAKLATVTSIIGTGGGLTFAGGTGTLAKPITITAAIANALTVRGATAADTVTLTGAITGGTAGTTALVVTGPGVTAIANNTTSNFAGDILVNGGGTLSLVTAAPTGGGTLDDSTTAPSTAFETGLGANGKLITLDNGTFRVAGTTTYNPAGGTKSFVIGAGGGTFDLVGRTLTLDDGTTEGASGAQLQGSGDLTITGTIGGLLQLSNTSNAGSLNFSGNITVGNNVRLQSGSGVGLGTTAGSTLVQTGGQLDFYSSTAITSAEPITINGTGPTSGTGAGAGALTNSANTIVVTLTGPMTLGSSSAIGQAGGGVGTMTLSGPIGETTTGTTLTKVGTGTVTLGGANSYSGGTIIQGGMLVSNSDGALGAASGGLTFNTGSSSFRFGTEFDLNASRPISIAAGITGTFDTNGFDSTISQAINTTATSIVAKSGAGTLTLGSAVTTAAPLNIAAGTLTAAAAANSFDTLTMTGGTLNGAGNTTFAGAANFTGPSTITSGAATSVRFDSTVTIGTVAASASLTVGAGSSFVMNAPASNFVMGNRTTANSSTVNDTFNAAVARNVSITSTNIQIGTTSGNPDNTSGTAPLLTFTLPTASNSTSTIVASGSIWLGIAENSGVGNAATFNLGGGTNDITTPLISVGGGKTGSTFGFPAASGGSLDLKGPANGKTNLIVGNNPDSGTGTNPSSSLNLTTTGTVTASLGFLRLGQSATTTAAGGAKGTFTLGASGPNSLVTADSVQLGVSNGNQVQTTSTFNLSAGTFKFNDGGTGIATGGGTATAVLRTTAINVSGGLLNMNNQPIDAVSTGAGTSTLTLTGTGTITDASTIGNFGTLTFSGGTLRNAGTINRAVTQTATTGASLLDVLGKTTTISGAYTLTGTATNSATASVALNQVLTTNSIAVNDRGVVKGNGTIAGPLAINSGGTVAPGGSVGELTTAATTWAGGGIYDWEVNTNVATTGQEGTLWDLLSTTSLTTTATSGSKFTIRVNRLAGASAPGDDEWFTIAMSSSPITIDPATFTLPDINGGANWEIRSADLGGGSYGVQVSAVPEPGSVALLAMAGIGLLARRRRRGV